MREIPCNPKRVLELVCQQCHTAPLRNMAPFPLLTYADTQAVVSGKPIWGYMQKVLVGRMMPLPPVQIEPADRAVLLGWLEAGAPPRLASDVCSVAGAGDDAADGPPDAVGDAACDGPDDARGAEDGGGGIADGPFDGDVPVDGDATDAGAIPAAGDDVDADG